MNLNIRAVHWFTKVHFYLVNRIKLVLHKGR